MHASFVFNQIFMLYIVQKSGTDIHPAFFTEFQQGATSQLARTLGASTGVRVRDEM
jgi:hypothetical protein